MMRLLLGLLLVGNLLLFLYGYLGLDGGGGSQQPQRPHEPDVGSIRLLAAKVSTAESRAALVAGEQAVQAETGAPEASEQPASEVAAGPAEKPVIATKPAATEEPGVATVSENLASVAPEQEPVAIPRAGEQEPPVVSEQPAPAPEEVTPPAAPQEPVTYCGTLGPFKSRIQAKRIRRKLGALQKIGIEQKPTLVDKSYWVLMPPLATRNEARAMVEKLKAAGVKDLWLVPKGDMRNAISLGLYSRKDAAYSHAENLRGKGFEVEVKPKQEEVSRYWLKFSGLDQATFEKLDPGVLPQGVEMDKKVCGQASSAP